MLHTSPRSNFNLIFLFSSSNDFAPIPILGPVVCVDHTLTPFENKWMRDNIRRYFQFHPILKKQNQINVPPLFILYTPTRSSEISEKNWSTKAKPFLTSHLWCKAILKVWRKSWKPFRIYQLTSTANPAIICEIWLDWLC